MTSPAMAMPTRRVDMWFAGPSPQNRATVAFRIILAIPQYIVLYILFIVTFFVAVIGWFGALFTGRLPRWAHEWISGVVRWDIRVYAYSLLLTDRYPPFSLDDQAYPARPILPPPGGELNRWAVFFRIILAVPAAVFANIVQYGLSIPLIIVMWVVILVRGSMPPTLYVPYAALLRYVARLHSWFGMLTSVYPWGMLGDRVAGGYPGVASGPGAGPPAAPPPGTMPQAAQPESQPAPQPPGWAAPQSPPPVPPPMAPPPMTGPPSAPPPPPTTGPPPYAGAMPPPSAWERSAAPPGETLPQWGTLVLEGASRTWMILAIVWGSVIFVGQNAAQTALRHNNSNNHMMYLRPSGSDGSGTQFEADVTPPSR